jgi:ABC-2 type transport system permease protein
LLGLFYVAVSLVAVQLSTSARGALGLAGAAIAVGYLVRGIGALQDSALVWASPFGWAQRMDAFGAERWWPACCWWPSRGPARSCGLAHRTPRLRQRRAAGPSRLTAAARFLGTPVGLVLRLQRGLLLGWAVGVTALAALYGAVIPTIPDLVASNPDLAGVIGASSDAEQALLDAFLSYIFLFLAVISTGFVIASVLRLRSEEQSGRSEAVLATRVRRSSWLGATVLVAGSGALVLSVLMGLGLALGYGLTSGEWNDVASHVGGQLSYLPGVLLVAAAAVAITAALPRWSLLAWAVLALVFLQLLLAQTLRLPTWLNALSPFFTCRSSRSSPSTPSRWPLSWSWPRPLSCSASGPTSVGTSRPAEAPRRAVDQAPRPESP